jgi:hypothetical protein
VKPEPRARRRAAVLVILAAALWWHAWMPALLLVAFVLWAVLHTRFEGDRRAGFMRFRARAWPPATLILIALIVAGTAVYGLSREPIEAKVLPIALSAIALAMLVVPRKRAVAVHAASEAWTLDEFAPRGRTT